MHRQRGGSADARVCGSPRASGSRPARPSSSRPKLHNTIPTVGKTRKYREKAAQRLGDSKSAQTPPAASVHSGFGTKAFPCGEHHATPLYRGRSFAIASSSLQISLDPCRIQLFTAPVHNTIDNCQKQPNCGFAPKDHIGLRACARTHTHTHSSVWVLVGYSALCNRKFTREDGWTRTCLANNCPTGRNGTAARAKSRCKQGGGGEFATCEICEIWRFWQFWKFANFCEICEILRLL